MVSMVLVSHSLKIVEGIKELINEMVQDVNIHIVGGTSDGRIGSDYDGTIDAIRKAYTKDGVVILFDLGSSYMTAEMAIETLEAEGMKNIKILDIPLVEGALTVAIDCSINKTLDKIIEDSMGLKLNKI